MVQPEKEPLRAERLLSHDLFNTLAVILGQCELLPLEIALNDTSAKRLRVIREAVLLLADQLQKYQSEIDAAVKEKVAKVGGATT